MKTARNVKFRAVVIFVFLFLSGKGWAQFIYAPEIEICYSWNNTLSQWDSTSKKITTYDTTQICNGFPVEVSSISYSYTSGQWIPNNKTESVWNNCLLLKDSSQFYNTSLNQWVNQSKNIYAYDSAGNRTEWTYFFWNSGTSQWEPSFKYLYQYNSQGKLTLRLILSYNSGNWDSTQKELYYYDGNGNETLYFMLYWNTGTSSWDSLNKRIQNYDLNGNLVEQILQNYMSGSWVYTNRTTWAYDGNGNTIERILYSWNSGTNQWDSINKWLFSYNASNQLTQEILQIYSSGTWTNNFKTGYVYDMNGNIVQRINYLWVDSTSSWKPTSQRLNTYDSYNNLIEYVWQNWVDSLNNFVNSSRCTYGYQVITSITSQMKPNSTCYVPNPYHGQPIPCEFSQNDTYIISLYNLEGKLIHIEQVQGNRFQLPPVSSSGIYFLQVLSEKGELLYQKKLLIE